MSDSPSVNPQFDKLDHQLLGLPRGDGREDRRGTRRRPVFAVRRIAPLVGSSTPGEAEFFCVESRDLTAGGFSFFMQSRPTFEALVLALDTSTSVERRTAEVVHCTDVWVYPSGLVEPVDDRNPGVSGQGPQGETAQRMVLVGCRFKA